MEKKIIEQDKRFYMEAFVHRIKENIYITSDEEIKDGDWVIVANKHIRQVKEVQSNQYLVVGVNNAIFKDVCKKIIATTDSELGEHDSLTISQGRFNNTYPTFKPLPRPSNSFIDKFLSEYNAGRKIEKVLVEMNREFEYEASAGKSYSFSLKVAPDNTIVIKPVVINKLEQLAVLLEKAGVRKYLNINSFGYSQIERDIVQLFE